jgi:small GTP-binding protein
MSSSQEQVKLVLLGDSGVGKSSLLRRFVHDTFNEETDSTMGASYLSKLVAVPGHSVKFNIWDTAGQERYRSLAKMYYRDAMVVLLVFALTEEDSFESLRHWYKEVQDNAPRNVGKFQTVVAVAGNKEDLAKVGGGLEESRIKAWTDSINAVYKRTSAKTNYGVDQLFQAVAGRLFPEDGINKIRDSVRLTDAPKNPNKKRPCC